MRRHMRRQAFAAQLCELARDTGGDEVEVRVAGDEEQRLELRIFLPARHCDRVFVVEIGAGAQSADVEGRVMRLHKGRRQA